MTDSGGEICRLVALGLAAKSLLRRQYNSVGRSLSSELSFNAD